MNKPESKQDVYNPYTDPQWEGKGMVAFFSIVQEARRLEYKFCRAMTLPVDPNVWNIEGDPVAVGIYDELPDAPVTAPVTVPETVAGRSIIETAMDYLASPDRSERVEVLRKLNAAAFFEPSLTTATRVSIIRTLINDYERTCGGGAERAREWFAEWLTHDPTPESLGRLCNLILQWGAEQGYDPDGDQLDEAVAAVVKILKDEA